MTKEHPFAQYVRIIGRRPANVARPRPGKALRFLKGDIVEA